MRLLLVGGLPGTGKTTLAGGLADNLSAVLVSSDRVRKELTGHTPTDPSPASYLDGIYTPAHTERVYHELLHRAEKLLARGESVVLDASWTAAAHRAAARAMAGRTRSRLVELCCDAPAEVTAARLRARTGSISDADPAVATAMRAAADPWPEATVVPTGGTPGETLRAVGPLVGAGKGTGALPPDRGAALAEGDHLTSARRP